MLKALGRVQLLILGDWGLAPLTSEQRRDLMEIMDDRHERDSTIVTSQVPLDHWHEVIGDPTIADAVLDRLVHNAHRLTLRGESLRIHDHAVVPTTTGTEGTSSNILRILAGSDGTVVKYNGATVATLNAGQYTDIRTGLGGGEVTSNNPILLNEYLTGQSEHDGVPGDPAQSYIPGVDQELSSYVFSTPVGSQSYVNNFLNISIATADIASLVLNGVAVPGSDCTALAGTIYSTCQISIVAGAGSISAANPFLLLIDGGTTYDSYLTFAGTTFSAGASPTQPTQPVGVPEPASLALLAFGIGSTWLARRRVTDRA